MKTFPILYSRTSTGATQTWQMFCEGNAYWAVSGQLGGKLIENKPTHCAGKNIGRANETTPEAQALAEAQSKFNKKKKSHYFEDIKDIDVKQFTEPMLAKAYKDHEAKVKFPVGVQIKYNGMRCVTEPHGMFSRKGEPVISCPHIAKSLEQTFKDNSGAFFDGELFNLDLKQKLNEIIKLARKTKKVTAADLAESEKIVMYYVYDGYGFAGITQETPYRERAKAIREFLKDNPYYRHVPTLVVNDKAELIAFYEKTLADGHEGIMIKDLDAPYFHKRTDRMLKHKPTDDAEFTILDIEEGKGNRRGTAGRVILDFPDGRTWAANLKGSHEQFAEVLKNKQDYIGKKATIFFNGYNGLGLPNNGQFDCNNSLGGAADK